MLETGIETTPKRGPLPSTHALKILHLDDEPFELERLSAALEQNPLDLEFNVESLDSLDSYKERLTQTENNPDVVILDIHIENSIKGGVSLVTETRRVFPSAVILMCSAMDDVQTIAECLNLGADDFLSKRSDRRELSLRVHNSWKLARLKRGIGPNLNPEVRTASTPAFVGNTFERAARRVPQIIASAISAVHVHGESGTGKEMVADLFSSRLGDTVPFVKVNCGAITPTLLESELFGHMKGAFTGALSDKKGLIEAASGGWIFLDEVASLSSSAQVALLRVLENQELMRVGANAPKQIKVRVLSATNEPLPELVKQGKFRKDLWQRLCEADIQLSPLRDRTDEIELLVRHFCKSMPGGPYQISEPALEVLTSLPWKDGNVRELRNCLRAMTELHVNKLLTPLAIPERIWKQMEEEDGEPVSQSKDPVAQSATIVPAAKAALKGGNTISLEVDFTKPVSYDELSDRLLLELTRILTAQSGRLSLRQLSKAIGVSRSTLSARLKGLVQKGLVELPELAHLVGLK